MLRLAFASFLAPVLLALAPGALPTISPDFKPSTPTLYLSVHDLPFL